MKRSLVRRSTLFVPSPPAPLYPRDVPDGAYQDLRGEVPARVGDKVRLWVHKGVSFEAAPGAAPTLASGPPRLRFEP